MLFKPIELTLINVRGHLLLEILAMLSMILANLIAVTQTSIISIISHIYIYIILNLDFWFLQE